jgi:hypothetical protein
MLFMGILTYEPGKRNELAKRRVEKGAMTNAKIIGEWGALGGGRIFRVIETDDPKTMLMASAAWGDLGSIELIPIMSTEESARIIAGMK